MDKKQPPIILASASPRRKLLFQQMGLDFQVIPAHCDETMDPGLSPGKAVEAVALRKALHIADGKENRLIVGSDTIVVLDGDTLGKPEDSDHAFTLLSRLRNQTHQVYTGVALVHTGSEPSDKQIRCFHERTDVTFGNLSDADIDAYIRTGSPMDKAGAYGIQDDLGALFVERIHGDYYNVVGFPLFRFYQEVNKFAPGFVTPFG
ncbi:Maf family protein [Balneolaceae bacterium ANBcel3]|nr:Maf family protein [Balneolaceae bacterium ANBcel3]